MFRTINQAMLQRRVMPLLAPHLSKLERVERVEFRG
jgi:hypothetical protein